MAVDPVAANDASWAMLVKGPAAAVRVLLASAIRATGWDLSHAEDKFVIVDGSKGWCGVYCLVEEEPLEEVADAMSDRGREIILLHFGSDYVDAYIARWTELGWQREYDRNPTAFARWLGVSVPEAPRAKRPIRRAALAEGVTMLRVESLMNEPTRTMTTDRGIVVFDNPHLASALGQVARAVYEVTHYLDNDTFGCSITRGGHVQRFEPGARDDGLGIERIEAVEGETDPRAIVRKLGIPEDHIFPLEYE